jgi:hypothetical protein
MAQELVSVFPFPAIPVDVVADFLVADFTLLLFAKDYVLNKDF